jgi:membrane carboxypeptidase/penicillin-binding protein
MKRLKQIVLFLLVVITIYSTMLFYLLMSVHADSRLQEIDYLEKIKPETPRQVLYIDRVVPINDR